MRKRLRTTGLVLLLIGGILIGSILAQPIDVDWTLFKQIDLTGRPLDVATSDDGQLLFVLLPGKVVVYSNFADEPLNEIPVDQKFDMLAHSSQPGLLMLTSSSSNALKIIRIDLVHDISIEGSPFKGPPDAPVTIAVFDDYQ
jgi:hypothetical protein